MSTQDKSFDISRRHLLQGAGAAAGASSSEMIRRMEARISSIVGSWALVSDMAHRSVNRETRGRA